MASEPMWRPTSARIDGSNLQQFILHHRRQIGGTDYASCYAWSIAKPAEFWTAVWEFCGVSGDRSDTPAVVDFDKMPGARWFPGATLNFAENLLSGSKFGPAIIFTNERGDRRELSWDQLRGRVASLALAMQSLGIRPGDRVAALLPNLPETTIAMLATASVGAIWSSCSPEFGLQAVLDRFGQIQPKLLFATDGYYYDGREIDCLGALERITAELPAIEHVVVVRYTGSGSEFDKVPNARTFEALSDDAADAGSQGFEFVEFPFSHPLYILYTSGTTGVPKSIVHSAGGTLLQHLKEHQLHTDIKPGDRVFYFTTCGWMMWHWLMSSLASGATIVLYDGMPLYPDPGVLWRMTETEDVAVFGTSAKYLSALEKSGYRPATQYVLKALRSVLSTGSPLAGTSFDFTYESIKEDLQLSSISGGTDIISCFVLGNPILPVYRGEVQCRGLGMKVDVFDDAGRPLRGAKGELVCTAPFPSMPLGFWNDEGDVKYRETYFSRFPNVWCHGDYAEVTEHDGIVLFGRSDTVLNPGGVRIGTAEIYRVVDSLPEVQESIAVGQEWNGDVRIVLFVRLRAGQGLDAALIERIRTELRVQASPRHVPAKILAVSDIPRTMSGKIVEVAVREVIHGRDVVNVDALANPRALDEFRNRPELAE